MCFITHAVQYHGAGKQFADVRYAHWHIICRIPTRINPPTADYMGVNLDTPTKFGDKSRLYWTILQPKRAV